MLQIYIDLSAFKMHCAYENTVIVIIIVGKYLCAFEIELIPFICIQLFPLSPVQNE